MVKVIEKLGSKMLPPYEDCDIEYYMTLSRLTRAGVINKLSVMTPENFIDLLIDRNIIVKLKDGNYYNNFMIAEITGYTVRGVKNIKSKEGLCGLNRIMFEDNLRWYEKLGFSSKSEAMAYYSNVPYSYFLQNVKDMNYDKKLVNEWYSSYCDHKSRVELARDLKNKCGIAVDVAVRYLDSGYTVKEILLSRELKIDINLLNDLVFTENGPISLLKLCAERNYNYNKLLADRKILSKEEFNSRIANGFYTEKAYRNSGVYINNIYYEYEQVAKILNLSRKSVVSMASVDKEKLISRVKQVLYGDNSYLSVILPNGVNILKKDIIDMYGVDLRYLNAGIKNSGLLNTIFNMEQRRFKREIKTVIDGVEYSNSELALFLNTTNNYIWYAIENSKLKELLIKYHFNERLRFKENSPYSEWYADDTWIYECQECKRKLLLTTEELVNYKHNDKLCVANEI